MSTEVPTSASDGGASSEQAGPPTEGVREMGGVHPGSEDPHGVGDGDVGARVAAAGRAYSFCLDAHRPATVDELLRRPFAELNVPAVTPQRENEAHGCGEGVCDALGRPPMVSRFEQLMTRGAWRRVVQWMRQLRRCLRCARQGRVRLAKRLRPSDLWMPASECMPPDVRPWDWDTTPLERGGLAVPTAPGRLCGRPECDVNVAAMLAAAEGFSDRALLTELVHGVDDGADTRAERGVLLCAPHAGGLELVAQAEAKITKSVDMGWASVHDAVPRWPLRVVPWSMVDESEKAGKPKYRMTIDLSWPKPGMLTGVTSVNDAADRSGWPTPRMLRLGEIAEAAGVMAASGVRVHVWCIDAVAFYRKYGRRRDQWHRQMMLNARAQWVLDRRPQFGGASVAVTLGIRAANLNAHHVRRRLRDFDHDHPPQDRKLLAWVRSREMLAQDSGGSRERWVALHVVGCFVDDTPGVSFADVVLVKTEWLRVLTVGGWRDRASCHFEVARAALVELGHESAVEKEQPPAGANIVLGALVSVQDNCVTLSADKRDRYARMAREVAGMDACPLALFRRLLGRLLFAAVMYPRARQWLHECFGAVRAQYRTMRAVVVVSREVRRQLLRWADELEWAGHPGVPLASVGPMPPPGGLGTVSIYADASGETGFHAWAVVEGCMFWVAGKWSAAEREQLIICEKEMIASNMGLMLIVAELHATLVHEFTDNTVVLATLRSLTPRTPGMQELVRRRVAFLNASEIRTAAHRISSKNNLWADQGSRGLADEVVRQALQLGLSTRRLHPTLVQRSTEALLRRATTAGGARRQQGECEVSESE